MTIQTIVSQYIPDLTIYPKGDRWHWAFRCTSSEDNHLSENGYNDSFQAVLGFASYQTQTLDDIASDEEDEDCLDDMSDDHPGFDVAFLGF